MTLNNTISSTQNANVFVENDQQIPYHLSKQEEIRRGFLNMKIHHLKMEKEYAHFVQLPPDYPINVYEKERLDLTTNLLGKVTVHIRNWVNTMQTTETVYKEVIEEELEALKTLANVKTSEIELTKKILLKMTEYDRSQIDPDYVTQMAYEYAIKIQRTYEKQYNPTIQIQKEVRENVDNKQILKIGKTEQEQARDKLERYYHYAREIQLMIDQVSREEITQHVKQLQQKFKESKIQWNVGQWPRTQTFYRNCEHLEEYIKMMNRYLNGAQGDYEKTKKYLLALEIGVKTEWVPKGSQGTAQKKGPNKQEPQKTEPQKKNKEQPEERKGKDKKGPMPGLNEHTKFRNTQRAKNEKMYFYDALPGEYTIALKPEDLKQTILLAKIPIEQCEFTGQAIDENFSHQIKLKYTSSSETYIGTPSFGGWCFHIMWYLLLAPADAYKELIIECKELQSSKFSNVKQAGIRDIKIKITNFLYAKTKELKYKQKYYLNEEDFKKSLAEGLPNYIRTRTTKLSVANQEILAYAKATYGIHKNKIAFAYDVTDTTSGAHYLLMNEGELNNNPASIILVWSIECTDGSNFEETAVSVTAHPYVHVGWHTKTKKGTNESISHDYQTFVESASEISEKPKTEQNNGPAQKVQQNEVNENKAPDIGKIVEAQVQQAPKTDQKEPKDQIIIKESKAEEKQAQVKKEERIQLLGEEPQFEPLKSSTYSWELDRSPTTSMELQSVMTVVSRRPEREPPRTWRDRMVHGTTNTLTAIAKIYEWITRRSRGDIQEQLGVFSGDNRTYTECECGGLKLNKTASAQLFQKFNPHQDYITECEHGVTLTELIFRLNQPYVLIYETTTMTDQQRHGQYTLWDGTLVQVGGQGLYINGQVRPAIVKFVKMNETVTGITNIVNFGYNITICSYVQDKNARHDPYGITIKMQNQSTTGFHYLAPRQEFMAYVQETAALDLSANLQQLQSYAGRYASMFCDMYKIPDRLQELQPIIYDCILHQSYSSKSRMNNAALPTFVQDRVSFEHQLLQTLYYNPYIRTVMYTSWSVIAYVGIKEAIEWGKTNYYVQKFIDKIIRPLQERLLEKTQTWTWKEKTVVGIAATGVAGYLYYNYFINNKGRLLHISKNQITLPGLSTHYFSQLAYEYIAIPSLPPIKHIGTIVGKEQKTNLIKMDAETGPIAVKQHFNAKRIAIKEGFNVNALVPSEKMKTINLIQLEQACKCRDKSCGYTKHGLIKEIPNDTQGRVNTAYTNCPVNILAAIFNRQGGAKTTPEPATVRRFVEYIRSPHSNVHKIVQTPGKSIFEITEYLKHIKKRDIGQAKLYREKWEQMLKIKSHNRWECFAKTYEWNQRELGGKDDLDKKPPRFIFSPPANVTIVGGTAAYNLKKIMKNTLGEKLGFGLSNADIVKLVQKASSRFISPVFYGLDGSSFDAHQHYALIKNVDHYIIKKLHLLERINIPSLFIYQAKKNLLSKSIKVQVRLPKPYDNVNVSVVGTMYSGNSFTTTGNTLRQLEYIDFIAFEHALDLHAIVAGDDVLLISEAETRDRFLDVVWDYFSQTGEGEHGLGQYVKEIKMYPQGVYEFLSKRGVYNRSIDKSGFYRQYERILFSQTSTHSQMNEYLLKQALANSAMIEAGMTKHGQIILDQLKKYDNISPNNDIQIIYKVLKDTQGAYWAQQQIKAYENRGKPTDQENHDFWMIQMNGYSEYLTVIQQTTPGRTAQQVTAPGSKQYVIALQHTYCSISEAQLAPESVQQVTKNTTNIGKIEESEFHTLQDSTKSLENQQSGLYPSTSINKQLHIGLPPKKHVQQVNATALYKLAKSEVSKKKRYPTRQEFKNAVTAHILAWASGTNRHKKNAAMTYDPNKLFPEQKTNTSKTRKQPKTVAGKIQHGNKKQGPNNTKQAIKQVKLPKSAGKMVIQIGMISLKGKKNKGKFTSVPYQTKFSQNAQEKSTKLSYLESILNPFATKAVRAPSDFYSATALMDYKFEYDWTPGATNAQLLLFPWWFGAQSGTNSPSWLNLYTGLAGGLVPWAPASVTGLNFVNPLAGGGTVASSPVNQWTQDPYNTTGGRWTSGRVVRCGVRIIPSSNITVKQGILTAGVLMGKNTTMFSMGSSPGSFKMPTPEALRQMATSFEVGLSALDQTGIDLIWLPLDPADQIFKEGWSGYLGANNYGVDLDTQVNASRSPMIMLLSNISPSDTYRIEVAYTVEYIPAMSFQSWTDTKTTPLTTDVNRTFSKVVMDVIGQAVSGYIGRELSGNQGVGQILGKYIPAVL